MGTPERIPQFDHPTGPMLEPSPSTRVQSARDAAASAVNGFSIVVGGPLYDFLQRRGLLRFSVPNILRRIAAVVALAWVPLLLLSLKDGLAFGNRVQVPFLSDFSVYGRFLLGLPLLLLAEVVIDPAIRHGLEEFVDDRIVPDQELPQFVNILQSTQRLRDSWIPEFIIFLLTFFPIFLFQHEWTAGALSSWHTMARALTPAGWWYVLFSGPLLKFFTFRWGFRYFLWAAVLGRISRLHLVLTPTHPDHAAGLNFLGLTQKHFGILFCAMGCSFAGRVANGMVFEGAPLSSFKFLMVGFVVLSVIVGLFPLTLLAPKLRKVRSAGVYEYGRLANSYVRSFDRKWVHHAERPSEPLLGTSDIQSLADIGNSFAFVEATRIAPITRKLAMQLAAWSALPLVPVIVAGTPTPELVKAIMKMVA
jgi:hypothetical protein